MANKLTSYFASMLSRLRGVQPPNPQDPNYGLPNNAFTTLPSGDTSVLAPIGFSLDENGAFKDQEQLPPNVSDASHAAPPAPIFAQPKAQAPPEAPQTGHAESERESALYKQFDQGIATLQQAPPPIVSAQVNPAAAIASLLLGSGVHGNPGMQSKVFNAPWATAEHDAAVANQNNQNAFAFQQKGAASTLDYVTAALGHEMSRDSVTERMNTSLNLADIKSKAAQTLAQIKTMPQFWDKLGKYGAGIGAPAIGEVLSQMGMTDPDQINAVTQGIISDPAAPLLIKKAQADAAAGKVELEEKANLRKMLLAPNATAADRLSSIMQLAEKGDPLFSGMNYLQMQAAASIEGNQTKLAGQRATDIELTRPQRIANLLKTGNLIDAKIEVQKDVHTLDQIRAQYLPALMQAQAKHLTSEANLADKKANDALYGLHNKPVTQTALFNAVNAAQKAIDSSQSLLTYTEAEHGRIQAAINALQSGAQKAYDKAGNEVDAKSKIAELQTALQSNESLHTYYTAQVAKNGDRLASVKKEAQAGAAGPTGAKMSQQEFTQKVNETQAALDAGKINQAQANKVFKWLHEQAGQ